MKYPGKELGVPPSSWPREPQNVALVRKNIFEGVISEDEAARD